ncbi:hypothetical protein BO82DRAFT_415952 [Aspergillus uvarum CBS 121591]|uniref:Uncharacterized protein n=1 Tax=Aspergillus uvarum CBS 121591 TaxID=1448315 RepID=A0A319CD35_9EURO|nr:hypothetical protein BO82DRAFT_415952 [Aspergillus uvarum CBS 121591]PYH81277.1 hypothetical protein BO82DRAFT_415952 [Aspergillus uvarum CBS 121591]
MQLDNSRYTVPITKSILKHDSVRILEYLSREMNLPKIKTRPSRGISRDICSGLLTLAISVSILVGLFITAGGLGDRVTLVALTIMGLFSSAASVAAWWAPSLVQRKASCTVPDADQLIITRGAAMVLVKCNEEVCRELYVGRDQCAFTFGDSWHRILLGVSTLLVMVSVVFQLQLVDAAGDRRGLLRAEYPILAVGAAGQAEGHHANPTMDKNYTQTLWLAIWHTQTTGWVKWANAMPATEKWAMWPNLARQNLQNAS